MAAGRLAHGLPCVAVSEPHPETQTHATTTSVLQRVQERSIMKRLFGLLCITALTVTFGACAKSVEKAQRDVDRAHNQAVRNVQQEQKDLQETQRDANDRVARQERRVEDAARQ